MPGNRKGRAGPRSTLPGNSGTETLGRPQAQPHAALAWRICISLREELRGLPRDRRGWGARPHSTSLLLFRHSSCEGVSLPSAPERGMA